MNQSLRIGLVGPQPPPNGGMAMQTAQLADLLRGDGVPVERLATNAPLRPALLERLPGLRALLRLLVYLPRVWRLAGRVDVIHLMANSGWSWQLFAAPVLWLARWRGTPVVVNYRGGGAEAYFRRSIGRVRPSLNRAALIAVPSAFLQQVFDRFELPTTVIPNIIDRSRFQPAAMPPAPAPFTLVVTRNLENIYRVDTAIRALARVVQAGHDAVLRIAGSGPQRESLQALASELDVADRVVFEGRLGREEIVALYQSAHAMLNPASVDNMPNSVIEALACGVAVISTDVGGVPFIVSHEETALLVPAGDDAALAGAIVRLMQDAALAERLRTNGLAAVEQYTWANVRQRWLQAYALAQGASA